MVKFLVDFLIRRFRSDYRITTNGYVARKADHRRRETYEHRNEAERILARRLKPREVVHHINGRRSDNRPENLCVMDHDDHIRYHEWYNRIYKTYGKYPRRVTQLRKLRENFNGIVLADVITKRRW